MAKFKIHPAIGIARLGNSEAFYLSPEQAGLLPIDCDSEGIPFRGRDGNVQRVARFKDSTGRVKRQAARFRVFVHDDAHPEGREIKVGDTFTFDAGSPAAGPYPVEGTVEDIEWTVHLANKKASWYLFKETAGIHGYGPAHKLRNPEVTNPEHRRRLIIDPGSQTVSNAAGESRAQFARGTNPGYPQSFPPEDLAPSAIDSLGEIRSHLDGDHARLIVLGGYGNAGSDKNVPIITEYANNDGWYDDVSDGPVSARIKFSYQETLFHTEGSASVDPSGNIVPDDDGVRDQKSSKRKVTKKQVRQVGYSDQVMPAWVAVGYPRYAPELVDMITMDEALYDLFVRRFAFAPQIYGVPPFTDETNSPATEAEWVQWRSAAQWNPDYYPKFFEELWPVLRRPKSYEWVWTFDQNLGADPHNTGTASTIDQPGGPVQANNLDKTVLSTPPHLIDDPALRTQFNTHRRFIYDILRKPGEENQPQTTTSVARGGVGDPGGDHPGAANLPERWFDTAYRPRAMPELAGDNPLSNTAPQKFLRLTDTQLFMFSQWATGKFVNECEEWGFGSDCENPFANPPTTGIGIDRGVLGNVVGGAFCPGAELTWIMLNPAIWSEPYRIKHASFVPGQLSMPAVVAVDGTGASLTDGMEPGDLTKYLALPWQSDFAQCTTQPIDVTYERWNNVFLDGTGDPAQHDVLYNVPWWPAHRPMVVFEPTPGSDDQAGSQVYWDSGVPENNAGGLRMVTAWADLGFIKRFGTTAADIRFVMVERNDEALGRPVEPGNYVEEVEERHRTGRTKRAEPR